MSFSTSGGKVIPHAPKPASYIDRRRFCSSVDENIIRYFLSQSVLSFFGMVINIITGAFPRVL